MQTPNTNRRSERGFSLTEVLVATSIFVIIFVAALLVYDRSNRIFRTGVESGDMQQQTRVAFDRMVADLRMMGYDFDRDGNPAGKERYQQPDEQVEFAQPHAITIRGNFDAELNAGDENGRESAYEPAADQFPLVTTGNDEIVTYALKSVNGANADSIEFYADTRKPRASYPGGQNEQLVKITGVDLCTNGCLEPPYTLYRITLKDVDLTNPSAATNFVWAPIAENIRSMELQYFQDARGTVPVVPNGGGGQWIVSSGGTPAAALAARDLRAQINSIRLTLTGMNAAPTYAYVSPVETALDTALQVEEAKAYRQYQLSSLINPRNVGLRGMQEYDTNAPGAPKVLSVDAAGCGIVKVTWEAPATGIVDAYNVIWDEDPNGTYGVIPAAFGPTELSGYVRDLDPTKTYYFIVAASNGFGSQRSINISLPIQPLNPTKSEPPAVVMASGGLDPDGAETAPVENNIIVSFKAPKLNVSPEDKTFPNNQPQATLPSPYEISQYRVLRADASVGTFGQIWPAAGPTPLTAPVVDTAGGGTFQDKSVKVSCRDYVYKLQAVEQACFANNALNVSGSTASAVSGESGVVTGKATANANPAKPQAVNFITGSSCSLDPCTIKMQWPEVTADVNGATIGVGRYMVRRFQNDGSGPTNEFTEEAVDNVVGDGTVTFTQSPASIGGTFYQYSVAGIQDGGPDCTTEFQGEYSDDRNFPCIQLTVDASGMLGLIDGDGSPGDPWLVSAPSGSVNVTATQAIASAEGRLYTADGSTLLTTVTGTILGDPKTAVVSVPLGGDDGATYRFEITVTDAGGCSNTEVKYITDSVTTCCLRPYKMTDGTVFFTAPETKSPVITQVTATVIDVKLLNFCQDNLTLKQIDVAWPTQGNPLMTIASFPPATGTTPIDLLLPGNNGADTPETITPPLLASKTIPVGSTGYTVRLRFNKAVDMTTSLFKVIPIYDRPAHSEVNVTCPVVQTPATSIP